MCCLIGKAAQSGVASVFAADCFMRTKQTFAGHTCVAPGDIPGLQNGQAQPFKKSLKVKQAGTACLTRVLQDCLDLAQRAMAGASQ